MKARIIVHGGAWSIPADEHAAHINGCHNAVAAAWPLLQAGATALEAVQAAIHVLEDDPAFDAGRGSVLTSSGEVELDAAIMNGATLDFGAVAAVKNFANPIDIARAVLETEFCMLVGQGAEAFAREHGIQSVDMNSLIVEREALRYKALCAQNGYSTHDSFKPQAPLKPSPTPSLPKPPPPKPSPQGTVGAVALDIYGNLAAATSTGGTPFKPSGRVGDAPLCGAGTYANNACGAASATGFGEGIMRTLMTHRACNLMHRGCPQSPIILPQDAAQKAIHELYEQVGGHAGIIMLDPHGNYGMFCNTDNMAHAYMGDDGKIYAAVDI